MLLLFSFNFFFKRRIRIRCTQTDDCYREIFGVTINVPQIFWVINRKLDTKFTSFKRRLFRLIFEKLSCVQKHYETHSFVKI